MSAARKRVTGTGLGLYICKQIIEAHRGKIWVRIDPGSGNHVLSSNCPSTS
ncbi:MAG: ATP-binding protein [Candidatus Moduliflexus flocculans]|nr:ATP-binding protein [Candidatus Moduliflexus flocculans]